MKLGQINASVVVTYLNIYAEADEKYQKLELPVIGFSYIGKKQEIQFEICRKATFLGGVFQTVSTNYVQKALELIT